MNAKDSLKPLVRGAYDLQSLRIQMGNRIVMNWKAKAGKGPGETDSEGLAAEDIDYLKMLKTHYRKIASGLAIEEKPPKAHERAREQAPPVTPERIPSRSKFIGDEIISSYTELVLLAQYIDIEKQEALHFRRLASVLEDFPIYTDFLEPTVGCGPAMSGVIISEIDIGKARYPSSLWAYAGLDVHTFMQTDPALENFGNVVSQGRSRRAHHLVDRTYINAAGEEAVRKSITFNPFLKTKLVGVLGPSFLKCGNATYRKLYDDYKHRLESDPRKAGWSKGHRHNASIRYMVKMFLGDLYNAWRAIEGLPIAPTYAEAKLGMGPDLRVHAAVRKTPEKVKQPLARSRAKQSKIPLAPLKRRKPDSLESAAVLGKPSARH